MSDIIKFNDTLDRKLFVVGCLHLNHLLEGVWRKRGYNSAQEHTDGVINKINKTCRANDILLVLGDFCLNTKPEQFNDLVNRINCELWFLEGNHPNPWIKLYHNECLSRFGYKVIGYKWLNKITYLGHYINLLWNKKPVICNHYPYYVFDGIMHGWWSLVSHSHGSCKLSRPEDLTMKQLDCGWEVFSRPVGFSEIKEIMDKKQIPNFDHHNVNNFHPTPPPRLSEPVYIKEPGFIESISLNPPLDNFGR